MIEQFKHDKSTVFSIAPFEVSTFHPGLYPGRFIIPACLDESLPQRLVIGASEHLMVIPDQKKPTRIVTPSFVIAKSIVEDSLDGQLWINSECRPGFCYFQGEMEVAQFVLNKKEIHSEMKAKQKNWLVEICKRTDDEWNKKKHHRVVSDQARYAAKKLGLSPEWLEAEIKGFTYVKCPACGISNDRNNAVCSSCRCVLDEKKFATLKFAS